MLKNKINLHYPSRLSVKVSVLSLLFTYNNDILFIMKQCKNNINSNISDKIEPVRLDKWLWACRFFKTRAISKTAIDAGKIHHNGAKTKPGKIVQIGDIIKLRQGFDEKTVFVLQLSSHRQSATIAQKLYQETDGSIIKREEIAQLRKISAPKTQGKPDKKQRRQIHRFKRQKESDND